MLESAKCRQTLTLVHILVGSYTVLNTDNGFICLPQTPQKCTLAGLLTSPML